MYVELVPHIVYSGNFIKCLFLECVFRLLLKTPEATLKKWTLKLSCPRLLRDVSHPLGPDYNKYLLTLHDPWHGPLHVLVGLWPLWLRPVLFCGMWSWHLHPDHTHYFLEVGVNNDLSFRASQKCDIEVPSEVPSNTKTRSKVPRKVPRCHTFEARRDINVLNSSNLLT